ncbi:MAG: divergent PAP2 family protein, partial [Dehalococcoidia bacterium]|nr:divergent PAP2 family protein [Dehalococcoidia bacterium]
MFDTLLSNKFFVLPATAWILAQSLKVVWILVTERRLRPRVFVRAGGMPSSHSAVVTALVTTIGRLLGLDSPLFAIAFFLAAIVMYDASGVRR